jgi:hypothetical protein
MDIIRRSEKDKRKVSKVLNTAADAMGLNVNKKLNT